VTAFLKENAPKQFDKLVSARFTLASTMSGAPRPVVNEDDDGDMEDFSEDDAEVGDDKDGAEESRKTNPARKAKVSAKKAK
jgi:hypothetical protein